LTHADQNSGLFVLDATWRHAERMARALGPFDNLVKRSIPSNFRTAYPRRQEDCPDPERGLATVEALYIASYMMGREDVSLLDDYYWRDAFLEKNKDCFKES
jgi:pre-rRNA-processing protein TSR3